MVGRTRERYGNTSQGRRYNRTNVLEGNETAGIRTEWGIYERCDDSVAKGDGHDLTVKRIEITGGVCNRPNPPSMTRSAWYYHNYRCGALAYPGDYVYDHLTIPGRPPDPALAAKILADTNPSRPVVDLPIAVYELREIPSLLKREGRGWLQILAASNLKFHFGLMPLVNDLTNLLNFSDEVNKRHKELNALASSGLRCKRRLWSGSTTGTTYRYISSSQPSTGNAPVDKTTSSRAWGFVEWFPDNNSKLMKGDRRALARQAVLGLTIDFSTAWNAIPWSWLVDWCSNVGDILIANRNTVGAHHGPVRIMETSVTHGSWTQLGDSAEEFGLLPAKFKVTTKTRRTVTPSLSAYLPILNARQLSILGSIGVTRRVPRTQ